MNTDQRFARRLGFARNQRQMRIAGDRIAIGDDLEDAPGGFERKRTDAFAERLMLAAVLDEVGDSADLDA